MMFMKKMVAVSALALLAGCSMTSESFTSKSHVQKLEAAEVTGSAFAQALAAEYRELAKFEQYKMYDYDSAQHFAGKGLAAAGGEEVAPDEVNQWPQPADKVAELEGGRQTLLNMIASTKDTDPARVAAAQARFDCWLEQQSENFQTDDIGTCRDEFKMLVAAEPPAYMVFFDWDKSNINSDAAKVLDEVAATVAQHGMTNIAVTGHADRSGSDAYNVGLSERRAEAVRKALGDRGVSNAEINLDWKGESQPLTPTADGVREPTNRRAEITLSK